MLEFCEICASTDRVAHHFKATARCCDRCRQKFIFAARHMYVEDSKCENPLLCEQMRIDMRWDFHIWKHSQLAMEADFSTSGVNELGVITEDLLLPQVLPMFTTNGSKTNLQLVACIGFGAFATVYEGVEKKERKAVKLYTDFNVFKKEIRHEELTKAHKYSYADLDVYIDIKNSVFAFSTVLMQKSLLEYPPAGWSLTLESQKCFIHKVFIEWEHLLKSKILHRDIKSDNLCISMDGTSVHFVDFGCSLFLKKNDFVKQEMKQVSTDFYNLSRLVAVICPKFLQFIYEYNLSIHFDDYDYIESFPHSMLLKSIGTPKYENINLLDYSNLQHKQ